MPTTPPPEDRDPLIELAHLASGVGHHVINAFAAIVSNAEILKLRLGGDAPIDPAAVAELIVGTALEASTVARRLIDTTRPITAIGEDEVMLDRVVADFVEGRRASAEPGVEWAARLEPVPAIRGHAGHLGAMLGLIGSNAVEARKEGEPIRVELSTAVDARGWVALEIADDGRGMSDDDRTRAVEPFFTTKPNRLGVGLSIANGIWRRHRGTLSLRSAPGAGTTLRLCVDPAQR